MKKEKVKDKQVKAQSKKYRQPKKPVTRNRYVDLIGLVIIIILGLIIYANSFENSFHFDDSFNIVDNTRIRDLSNISAMWELNPARLVAYYTFAINYHFGELNVWGYHLVNLIIHLINASLVWGLTFIIFSSPALKDSPIIQHKSAIAFFAALLFVSHPLATQSVTYIVQRMNSLAAMFYLLTVLLYAKARLSEKMSAGRYLLFTGSGVAAVFAMLTKENAFTLPLAIILFEIFFLRKKKISINFKNYKVILITAVSLCAFILLALKISSGIFSPLQPSLGNAYTVTPLNYFLTQLSVIVKYIQLLFLPINQNLDYDYHLAENLFEIRTILSSLFLLSLLTLALFLFNKNRIISFGIFWFFLTISIESSFVPLEDLIFEHRTYLPSFGFFLIVSSTAYGLLWNKSKFIAPGILLLIATSYSFLTFQRNKVWKDDLTLWSDVVSKSPGKARPLGTRGDSYRSLGQFENAIIDYTKALEINPDYSTAYHNRAGIYENQKEWNKALADYSNAIRVDPEYRNALYNRGNIYSNLGQWDNAVADYSAAIAIDPQFTFAYYARSLAYGRLRKLDQAVADASKAIEIDPNYGPAYTGRAFAYHNLGQWEKAIIDYSKAIEIDPKDANTYYNRGIAYGNLGRLEEAIADYSKAIELNPGLTNAINNREIAMRQLRK